MSLTNRQVADRFCSCGSGRSSMCAEAGTPYMTSTGWRIDSYRTEMARWAIVLGAGPHDSSSVVMMKSRFRQSSSSRKHRIWLKRELRQDSTPFVDISPEAYADISDGKIGCSCTDRQNSPEMLLQEWNTLILPFVPEHKRRRWLAGIRRIERRMRTAILLEAI